MEDKRMTMERVLKGTGECGPFQWWICTVTQVIPMIAMAYGLAFMAYGNYNPGMRCIRQHGNSTPVDHVTAYTNGTSWNNTSLDNEAGSTPVDEEQKDDNPGDDSALPSSEFSKKCDAVKDCEYEFSDDASTVVTEWNLVCSRSWLVSIIISVQMSGLFLGALIAGHVGDQWGRKGGLLGYLSIFCCANIVAIFSISWQMFAVARFFIGVGTGGTVIFYKAYPMEFLNDKWRANFMGWPVWNPSVLSFIAFAFLLRDWRQLQILTAVISFLVIPPLIFVPESLRWLVVKGKKCQAIATVEKIARINGRPAPPTDGIMELASSGADSPKAIFSYLSLFRNGFWRLSIRVAFVYFSESLIYYSIFFGVKSLSGDFFLNFALMNLVGIIKSIMVIPVLRIIGRKWGGALLFFITALVCVSVVLVHFTASEDSKGIAITVLALASTVLLEAGWSAFSVFCVELYPTVMRTLSIGYTSSCARIGGVVAPFLIPRESNLLFISFAVMTGLTVACSAISASLPETKGKLLNDFQQLRQQDTDRGAGDAQREALNSAGDCEQIQVT